MKKIRLVGAVLAIFYSLTREPAEIRHSPDATRDAPRRETVVTQRGRFAPSPTGPLHLGSLLAAFGSWLLARRAGAEWWVRVEDIDPPRERHGAAELQLRQEHVVTLETRPPTIEGKGEVTIRDLVINTLRMRPDGRQNDEARQRRRPCHFALHCTSHPTTGRSLE